MGEIKEEGRFQGLAIALVTAYVAAQLISNIASLKLANVWGFSLDAGTFIYPLTFTLRDLVHKRLGRSGAVKVVFASAAANAGMALYLALACVIQPDPYWTLPLPSGADPAGADAAFNAVLGPSWRIVAASVLAMVLSELADTQAYHLWVTRVTTRFQWLRVLVSNSISVPLDSMLFCWVAFGGLQDNGLVWSIVWTNILVKMAVTLASIPSIYAVKENAGARA